MCVLFRVVARSVTAPLLNPVWGIHVLSLNQFFLLIFLVFLQEQLEEATDRLSEMICVDRLRNPVRQVGDGFPVSFPLISGFSGGVSCEGFGSHHHPYPPILDAFVSGHSLDSFV